MPNLHRREFCSNLMAFSGGVFLSRPLGLALKSFIPRSSSLGDQLSKEALSELEYVTDRGQRGELTRQLAPLFAPSDPDLAMSLLTEGLEEAEAQFSRLPKEGQEGIAKECDGKPRIGEAERAIFDTLTRFPIHQRERSRQVAESLGAPWRAKSAILARAYSADRLSLEDIRCSLSEEIFHQFLAMSLARFPPRPSQVPEILAAVEVNFSSLEKAETYSRYLRWWPATYRTHLADLIRKEAVTLAEVGQLKAFVHNQLEFAGLINEDSILAWDLLQRIEPEGEDLEWLMPKLAKIAKNLTALDVPAKFLTDLKSKVESHSEDCQRPEMQLYLSYLMARVDADAALRYAYETADSTFDGETWVLCCRYFDHLVQLQTS